MSSTEPKNSYYRDYGNRELGIDSARKTKELLSQVNEYLNKDFFKTGEDFKSHEDIFNTISKKFGEGSLPGIIKKLLDNKVSVDTMSRTLINLAQVESDNFGTSWIDKVDFSKLKRTDNGSMNINELKNDAIRAERLTESIQHERSEAKKNTKVDRDLDFDSIVYKNAIKKFGFEGKLSVDSKGRIQQRPDVEYNEEERKKLDEMGSYIRSQNSVTDADKDFALKGMAEIMDWNREQYEGAVHSTISGEVEKNKDIIKAQDLMKVKTKEDANKFMKKYGIKDTEENRHKLSEQRGALKKLSKQRIAYNKLIQEGKSKEELINNHPVLRQRFEENKKWSNKITKDEHEENMDAKEKKSLMDPVMKFLNDNVDSKKELDSLKNKQKANSEKLKDKQASAEKLAEGKSPSPETEDASAKTSTSPIESKKATGQARENSSGSKSSSSSAQDINVSINLVLDDKVIQAITQKVTAGQNKN